LKINTYSILVNRYYKDELYAFLKHLAYSKAKSRNLPLGQIKYFINIGYHINPPKNIKIPFFTLNFRLGRISKYYTVDKLPPEYQNYLEK